ncbi:hypothetical protein [Nitratireductor aquibiodomus]|uniref:hypothetical protein n=1 Tax=Nitratireductor aquibiodomus TaxID=204799 RepID=UPI00030145C5|nr:hypothetical protein [Nitratireductor aquibiodomus]
MNRRDRKSDDLELLELLEELGELTDATGIPELLGRLLDIYGLKTVAYLALG